MKKYLPFVLLLFSCIAQAQTSALVEIDPKYAGGMAAFNTYLHKYITYPANALKEKIAGKVLFSFTIETDGHLDEVKILESPSPDLGNEVTRVLAISPHWLPGMHEGHAAITHLSATINFDLTNIVLNNGMAKLGSDDIVTLINNKPPKPKVDNVTNDLAELDNVTLKEPSKYEDYKDVILPQFPGGEEACADFFWNHIHYPKSAHDNRIEGKVFATFTIGIDGKVSDIKIVKSVSPDIDREAVRVISIMPKWKPATKDGKPISIPVTVPINFHLKI